MPDLRCTFNFNAYHFPPEYDNNALTVIEVACRKAIYSPEALWQWDSAGSRSHNKTVWSALELLKYRDHATLLTTYSSLRIQAWNLHQEHIVTVMVF